MGYIHVSLELVGIVKSLATYGAEFVSKIDVVSHFQMSAQLVVWEDLKALRAAGMDRIVLRLEVGVQFQLAELPLAGGTGDFLSQVEPLLVELEVPLQVPLVIEMFQT